MTWYNWVSKETRNFQFRFHCAAVKNKIPLSFFAITHLLYRTWKLTIIKRNIYLYVYVCSYE